MAEHEKTNGHNTLRVLLIGEQAGKRSEVGAVLGNLAEPELAIAESSFEQGADAKGAEVMMVLFDDDEDAPLNYLQEITVQAGRPPLFALLPKRSPSLMRRALRAGADELLFLPLEEPDAARALLKISEARRRSARIGSGKVISLISMVGGVGVTTLAANLGLALHRSHG
jgi:Flp pilus assembly CpaE family ATPase